MEERKRGITNEGLRSKWFLPVLILVFIVMGIVYNRGGAASGELRVKESGAEDAGIANLPLEMYLSVDDYKTGSLSVTISNQSGYEMQYTEGFSLEKKVDDAWEELTPQGEESEGSAHSADDSEETGETAHTIADLEEAQLTLDISGYEPLEEGEYRLLLDDMYAEFALGKS